MKPYALALLALVACGGGSGGNDAPADSPVVVSFAPLDYPRVGECDWESGSPVRISIDPAFSTDGYRDAILRHELFHALTRIKAHSGDESCISHSPAPDGLWIICDEERAQVLASPLWPIVVSFPDDPDCLDRVASWWNWACGRIVVEVSP